MVLAMIILPREGKYIEMSLSVFKGKPAWTAISSRFTEAIAQDTMQVTLTNRNR